LTSNSLNVISQRFTAGRGNEPSKEGKMKRLLMVIPMVFLLCFAFSCQQGEEVAKEPVVDVEADVEALKNMVNEWMALYNASDFERLVSFYYEEDAVRMPPDIPMLRGKAAILARFKKDIEQSDEHLDSSIIEDVRVSGDMAMVRGNDTGTSTPKGGGEPTRFDSKWLGIFERQPDSTWKCIYEIWNSNLPLPPLSEKE
jgi:ketosteroid isomerase-like protein